MVYVFDGFNYVVRLDKGERLQAAREQFVQATGGALETELGFYNLDAKEYLWLTFTKKLEIASLQGTLARDAEGKPAFHLHGTFCDEHYQTIGGHVRDMVVGGTCEIFVHRSYKPLQRKVDPAVGLQVLDIHDSN